MSLTGWWLEELHYCFEADFWSSFGILSTQYAKDNYEIYEIKPLDTSCLWALFQQKHSSSCFIHYFYSSYVPFNLMHKKFFLVKSSLCEVRFNPFRWDLIGSMNHLNNFLLFDTLISFSLQIRLKFATQDCNEKFLQNCSLSVLNRFDCWFDLVLWYIGIPAAAPPLLIPPSLTYCLPHKSRLISCRTQ